MNEKIKQLLAQAHLEVDDIKDTNKIAEKFAELIVSSVLDEVNKWSYYTGDRDWSDELDRKWIELEFGFGELAE